MTYVVSYFVRMKLTSDTSFNLDVTQAIWQKKVKHHYVVEPPDGYLSDLPRIDHVVTRENMTDHFPLLILLVEFLIQLNIHMQDKQYHKLIS